MIFVLAVFMQCTQRSIGLHITSSTWHDHLWWAAGLGDWHGTHNCGLVARSKHCTEKNIGQRHLSQASCGIYNLMN